MQPVHDPSIMRQGGTYYSFSTDVVAPPSGNYIQIRCSKDKQSWRKCGSVFPQIPSWVKQKVPGVDSLWAPDISYFNGLYHLYYAGSTLESQVSVIGVATNPTLDVNDPAYNWQDGGEVIESTTGDDFNAIDPNILVVNDGSVWMSYGSYWSGIKQVEIDPATSKPMANATTYDLAARPDVENHPIEGASIIYHNGYYYLFVSFDYCCKTDVTAENYKEAVGRSTSPHGPFVDESGVPMLEGGGTVLLDKNEVWYAAGGATAYIDSASGESLLVFHALNSSQNGYTYLWVKHIAWQDDWPALW